MRDLRIALWLGRDFADLTQIRTDLSSYYTDLVEAANRGLRTQFWGDKPTAQSTHAIKRELTGPEALEKLLRTWSLDPVLDSLVRLGLSILLTDAGQRVVVSVIHQFFSAGPGDIPDAVKAFRESLPSSWSPVMAGAEEDFALVVGLLAHPDGFENPLLLGILNASDTTLLNLREAVWHADSCWTATLQLGSVVMDRRAAVLGPLELIAPLLATTASRLAARSPFRNPAAGVAVMAVALASERVREDQGKRLAQTLRLTCDLAEWLARHPEVVDRIEGLSSDDWERLAAEPDFPTSGRIPLTSRS